MFGKRKEKVKYKNKKGCWHTIWPGLTTIIAVVIAGVLFFLDQFLAGADELQKYVNLLSELEETPTDAEMAPNKITSTDRENFETLINSLVTNNDGNPLFDENGNFIYANLQPENLTYTGTALTLDKTNLACLIESSLGAGWVSDLYEDGESILTLLQVTTLQTSDGRTTITAVGKLKLGSLLIDATPEEQKELEVLDALPDDVYFVYTASFDYGAEDRNISSSMWINQLTADSNSLLLGLIFDEWLDENDATLTSSLNSIIEWALSEFDNMLTMWDCTATFDANNIVITKN